MKRILIPMFILFLLTTKTLNAQTSCCAKPEATVAFANFSNDAGFRAAHAAPLPFVLADPKGKDISFPTPDGKPAHAWVVSPVNPSSNYLFVFHEWWGLNDYIKKECERLFTDLGDVNVIAIDLYDNKVADNADSAAAYVKGLQKERAISIIKGAIKFVGKEARIYTIGWCLGGAGACRPACLPDARRKAASCIMECPKKKSRGYV